MDLQVKTRVIRKEMKEKGEISEETSKSTFRQKLHRERVKKTNDQLKEIVEAKSIPSQDVNEPYIVYSSINDSKELRYMMIIRYFNYKSWAYSSKITISHQKVTISHQSYYVWCKSLLFGAKTYFYLGIQFRKAKIMKINLL